MNRFIPTRDGEFTAAFSEIGLARIEFPKTKPANDERCDAPRSVESRQVEVWFHRTIEVIHCVLEGKAAGPLPPLDIRSGTPFQQQVWNVLLRIPLGHTMTYGEVAESVGRPRGSQAVGQACGANPIPLIECPPAATGSAAFPEGSNGKENCWNEKRPGSARKPNSSFEPAFTTRGEAAIAKSLQSARLVARRTLW
jgi:O6-methylguanine-DNA--protein-cysteine methyltransferase